MRFSIAALTPIQGTLMRDCNFVEFDATEDGMKLMAAFLIHLRQNRQDFTSAFTKCGQSIRVTLI